MSQVPGLSHQVPGTRNLGNLHQYRKVPGVPGVPGLHARVHARAASHRARTFVNYLPRVYTRNTRNTRNNDQLVRLSEVPGTRNLPTYTRNLAMTKPLRQQMPTVAGWIDDLRAEFGPESINASIKSGIVGQPTFWAREGGAEIGTRAPHSVENSISLADTLVGAMNAPSAPQNSKAKGK